MKNKFTKRISLVLATVLATSVLSACGSGINRDEGAEVDNSKSQLYVGVWDGGYGSAWCETWASDFEELYADESFEKGKKGVQIIVEKSKSYAEDRAAVTLTDSSHDIIFTEQTNYYEFVRLGTTYDVTEWVTTPMTEYGESKSIVDKMNGVDREYYNASDEGKEATYYGMPWYVSFANISYDVDLFDDYGFYFAEPGKGDSQGFIKSNKSTKSTGPDGVAGTSDDGLPATYDQFFILCDRMVESGVTPIVWGGGVQEYVNLLVTSFCVDIMGYDAANVGFQLDGSMDKLVSAINNGIVAYEKSTAINNDNGYIVKSHEGYYHALKFFHRLLTTKNSEGRAKYYDDNYCYSQSASHTGAQTKFLQSKYSENTNTQPIAMLIDGTWWYNEATDIFKQMASIPGAGQYERRIGIMPTPKVDESRVGQESTLVSTWTTSVVVRKNINENIADLARAFYRYIHTDKALSGFAVEANGIRPFDYTLPEDAEEKMSYFTKQQYDFYNNGKVVIPYSKNTIMRSYLNSIYGRLGTWQTVVGDNSYSLVTTAFGKENVSVEDYFFGLAEYLKVRWSQYTK